MNRRDLSQPHRRRGQTGRWLLALIAGLVLGCAETRYAAYSDVAGMTELPYRTVVFEIGRAFYTDFPDCALIMPPAPTKGDGRFAALVEMALGRYLTGKFTRVINPTERDIVARRIAADLSQLEDRLALAEEVRCDSFVFTDLLGPRSKNLIVWSQIRVGLEVRMVRASDGHLLWRARHVASRSEGGRCRRLASSWRQFPPPASRATMRLPHRWSTTPSGGWWQQFPMPGRIGDRGLGKGCMVTVGGPHLPLLPTESNAFCTEKSQIWMRK